MIAVSETLSSFRFVAVLRATCNKKIGVYHMVKETHKNLIKNCFLVVVTIRNDGNSGDSKVRMISGNVGCSGDVGTGTFKFKEYSVLEFACKHNLIEGVECLSGNTCFRYA